MATLDHNSDLSHLSDADGYGSAWEPPTPNSKTNLNLNRGTGPASTYVNIDVPSTSNKDEINPSSLFQTSSQTLSKSDTFVNATPSGEVQIRRPGIFDKESWVGNNCNYSQSENTSSLINETRVPEGQIIVSQVPVMTSDYVVRGGEQWSDLAMHAVTRCPGHMHDLSSGVDAVQGKAVSNFRGGVLTSNSISQHPAQTWDSGGACSNGNQGKGLHVQTNGGMAEGIEAWHGLPSHGPSLHGNSSNNYGLVRGPGDSLTQGVVLRREPDPSRYGILDRQIGGDLTYQPPSGYEPHRKDRKPAPYDGKSDWRNYLVQFEMVAEINRWDPITKALELAICLRGPAAGILFELGPELRRDYNAMVAALDRQFGPGNDIRVFKTKLRSRVRGKGEQLPALLQDIKRLVSLAYPGADMNLRDNLTLDQFVLALNDPDMQWNVIDSDTKTAEEALWKCQKYEAFHNSTQGGQFNVRGHVRATGESELALYRHEEIMGKLAKMGNVRNGDHNTPPQRELGNSREIICYFCQERGHIRPRCPKLAEINRNQGRGRGNFRGSNMPRPRGTPPAGNNELQNNKSEN